MARSRLWKVSIRGGVFYIRANSVYQGQLITDFKLYEQTAGFISNDLLTEIRAVRRLPTSTGGADGREEVDAKRVCCAALESAIKSPDIEMGKDEDGHYYIFGNGGVNWRQIIYCPFCGRKVKEDV